MSWQHVALMVGRLSKNHGKRYSGYRVKLSIGELAKATNVKIVTIRYYEQVGLMPAPSVPKETTARIIPSTATDCSSSGDCEDSASPSTKYETSSVSPPRGANPVTMSTGSPTPTSPPSKRSSEISRNSRPNSARSATDVKEEGASPNAASSKHSHPERYNGPKEEAVVVGRNP